MGLQGTENSVRVSAATLALWKMLSLYLQTTTPLCTTRQDFITIKPQNFTGSLSFGCSGIAIGGHVLADQPLQHEVQLPGTPGKFFGHLLEA